MNWPWHKHVPCPDAERAVNEALSRAEKNHDLIRREGEITAREFHVAERFRERRESNGFLEMIEEIFVKEAK